MNNRAGFTVWLTGLPGAGKSTLAGLLSEHLSRLGMPVKVLEGDEVRVRLGKGLGFTKADRNENVSRIAYVAGLISSSGGVAIVAAISPYADARSAARREIGNFVEVFVSCPVHVCIVRDPKGLYAMAQQGKLPQFTGISDPYEKPENPDITIETHMDTPDGSVEKILVRLNELGFIGDMA